MRDPVELFELGSRTPTQAVIDPVCRMTLPRDHATLVVRRVADVPVRFCSTGCADEFERTPERYLVARSGHELGGPA